ncbi:plastocyanin/azurin family copper-binding protein [Reichenbachiella versicolor]|uniref:plastocyanin/azurin family copper-binding protein n=1 Tax=Reichenbachiella versicolor TaxID=1821036 RepID=UPI000D6DDDAE|nr:plastocyanin/azurin family copper-binding protein [Reichenbachiella versicolor]
MNRIITLLAIMLTMPAVGQNVSDYYRIKNVNIPKEIKLEVGGVAFDDKGRLGVSTRRGELWLITNPYNSNPTYKLFGQGMHENLGLAFKDGSFYTAQRSELTRVTDTDGDDIADKYETVYGWDISGNYHEYSFGPKFMPNGDMVLTLNLGWSGGGKSLRKWRGWMIKVTPEGEMIPWATGLRSPAGFGINSAGDIFFAENQGDWVGSGRVTHLEKGDFAGHIAGLKWTGEPNSPLKLEAKYIDDQLGFSIYDYSKIISAIKPPSVWFPHTLMGVSTSDISEIPDDFGPFKGQMLVGDQGHSKVMRMFQEKVNGVYQGACFPFVEGFESGVLRFEWGSRKDVFVGMTSRGWSSTGPKMYGLQRLEWTGRIPFEVKAIRAQPDGFELEFTKAVDRKSAEELMNYEVSEFTYLYHQKYGSPVQELESRIVHKVTVSDNGMKARIYLDRMKNGYIYSFSLPKIKSRGGEKLLHKDAYYTLNEIPEGARMEMSHDHAMMASTEEVVEYKSDKRVTEKPADWEEGEIVNIDMTTVSGLKFDKDFIEVNVGDKVRLTFHNPDDMLHNFVITKPGTIDAVVKEALNLGLKGQQLNYVPISDDVLFHTKLMQPETEESIYFQITERGEYHFVCSYPGHGQVMRGILRVK